MTKKLALPLKTCQGCGGSFLPRKKNQKYCTDTCRVKYYSEHYFVKVEITKVCLNCGASFPTTCPKKQDYCSPDCRIDAQRKRAAGVAASYTAERQTYLEERFTAFERDEFKCTYCGRGTGKGVKLDVEDNGKGGLRTICTECKTGKESVK